MIFMHVYVASSVVLSQIGIISLYCKCPPLSAPHILNLSARLPNTIVKYEPSNFSLNFFAFSLFRGLGFFHTLYKNHYKMQICSSIFLSFSAL